MRKVNVRDFQRNFYEWLDKREDIVVTIRGKEAVVVTFIDKDVVTSGAKEEQESFSSDFIPNHTTDRKNTYGCGCERKEGAVLCQKHGRT